MQSIGRILSISALVFLCGLGVLSLQSTPLSAQENSVVLGGKSLARECYARSQTAAISHSATRHDIEMCGRAISDSNLVASELAALYSNRGVIYMAMEKYKRAYKDYQKALKIDSSLAEAYINRGNLWFAVQKYGKAIADYDEALKYKTNKPAVTLLNRGLARESGGDLAGAKFDYLASLDIKPAWQPGLDKLARVNAKLQNIEK